MSSTEDELRKLAASLGVRFEDSGGDVTLVGDDKYVWSSTGTHDLFVEVGEFETREAALKSLLEDAKLGRVLVTQSPSDNPRLTPPTLRRDWVGKKVRLRRKLYNGYICVPDGAVCVVAGAHRGANLRSEPCKCCGVSVSITAVPWSALEYLG